MNSACVVPGGLQVRGPPAKAAFDASGAPTKALEGFCRKNGVSADAVVREADPKGVAYCWLEVKDAGKPAAEVRVVLVPGHRLNSPPGGLVDVGCLLLVSEPVGSVD